MPSRSGREAKQRWRLTLARDERAAELTERATIEALVNGLSRAGLPLATSGEVRARPRLALAAPLPRGARAEADLVEVYLSARLPLDVVRPRVVSGLPEGFRLVDLEDEWVGAPSLASRLVAMEYRVDVATSGPLLRAALQAALAAAGHDGTAKGDSIGLAEWDEDRGRGSLVMRLERDEAGRITRPASLIDAVGSGLRLVGLTRTSLELAGRPANGS